VNASVSRALCLVWVAVCSALGAWPAAGDAYHVAPHGNDSATGSAQRPFATIQRGVHALAPGDELIVHAGTYAEVVTIWARDGREDAPLVIRAADGDKPVLDGSHLAGSEDPPNALLLIGRSSWIEVRGLEVRNAPSAGIVMASSRHIAIAGNHVHHAQTYGIRALGTTRPGESGDIRIEHNLVHHTVLHNVPRELSRGWAQAVSVMYTDGATIRGNDVGQNFGEGIDAILSANVTIVRNRVHDNYGTNVYLDNAQRVTVDGNFIFNDDALTSHFRAGKPAAGISAANERYETALPLRHLRITNNIVLWCATAFLYGNWDAGGGLHETVIANNTFYGSRDALVWIEDDAHDSTRIVNNLFLQTGNRAYAWVPKRGITFRRNAWYGGRAETRRRGAGDVTADPQLVNAGGGAPEDYRPGPDSPLGSGNDSIGAR
jgi:hypothetical protein